MSVTLEAKPIVALDVTDLVAYAGRLDELYRQLQRSQLTVGCLESQLEDCRVQAEALPLAEAEAKRLEDLARENERLADIAGKAGLVESIAQQNNAMRELIREKSFQRVSWWSMLRTCLLGDGSGDSRGAEPYAMADYHAMIQRQLGL